MSDIRKETDFCVCMLARPYTKIIGSGFCPIAFLKETSKSLHKKGHLKIINQDIM